MKKNHQRRPYAVRPTSLAIALLLLAARTGHATSIDTPIDGLDVRWDNSLKFSSGYRLKDPSESLISSPSSPNSDDGNRNFKKGFISNRFDLLTELDANFKKKFGARISAAAWYDSAYMHGNDNDSPFTVNNTSSAYNEFSDHTQRLHGTGGEVLDAFVYGNGTVGDSAVVGRLGRHTLLYGESLFFGSNGIAGGQSPIDVIKAQSVPNSQFKEIIRPVNQLSGQIQLRNNLALGGYYQFEWRPSRLPSAGSYFATGDMVEGGQRFLLGPGNQNGMPQLARGTDHEPKNSGQGGMQIRWRPEIMDVELGFYAIRYHDKTPQVNLTVAPPGAPGFDPRYFNPVTGEIGNYQLAYGEGIKAYGMSFSTETMGANIAGEVSVRRNTPLVSDPSVSVNPVYAVGNSAHAQVSVIAFLQRNSLFDSASLTGEVAANTRTSITQNASALAANSSKSAWASRFVFEPSWYQVAPGWDMSAPIGLGYSTHGNSSVVSQFNGGVKKGGDLTLGIKGVYRQTWNFGLTYTQFLGTEGNSIEPTGPGGSGQVSFKQSLKDRNYISFSAQHSF